MDNLSTIFLIMLAAAFIVAAVGILRAWTPPVTFGVQALAYEVGASIFDISQGTLGREGFS